MISCCRDKGLGMGFLLQAFDQLGLGFFSSEAGNFFQPADMFFLVFFQFGALWY